MSGSRYLGATDAPDSGPAHDMPEVAVVGRSNVGKSSLLNGLLGAKLARTSRTPGRTQLLHFFALGGRVVLVDLPGVGFAKAPKKIRARLRGMVYGALTRRDAVVGVLILVDIRRAPGDQEQELLDAGVRRGLRVLVVATKADKLSRHQRKPALERLARWAGRSDRVACTSAAKNQGLTELRARLLDWGAASRPDSHDEEEEEG